MLNKAINAALADPKMQKRIAELGGEPMPMTPAEFGKLVADETEKWGKVVKAANFRSSDRRARTRPHGGVDRAADHAASDVPGAAQHGSLRAAKPTLLPTSRPIRDCLLLHVLGEEVGGALPRQIVAAPLSKLPRSSQWKPWPASG